MVKQSLPFCEHELHLFSLYLLIFCVFFLFLQAENTKKIILKQLEPMPGHVKIPPLKLNEYSPVH